MSFSDHTDTNVITAKRDWLNILYDILEVCKNSPKKTRLMYNSNMNSKQMEGYLQFLIERGMVKRMITESNGVFFEITELGQKYVNAYSQLTKVLDNL